MLVLMGMQCLRIFLHRPKPAEVLLENGGHRLIRKREDYSVLLGNQM